MAHVANWWAVYLFDSPLRRLILNPEPIFSPYVAPGMTVLDIGCGAGSHALCMARLVGESGRVIAVDIQQPLLNAVARRARRARLADRIETRLVAPDSIGVEEPVDFVNAFWMIHETPDPRRLLEQIAAVLQDDGTLLAAEPRGHVSEDAFRKFELMAEDAGLRVRKRPTIRFSRAAVFAKAGGM